MRRRHQRRRLDPATIGRGSEARRRRSGQWPTGPRRVAERPRPVPPGDPSALRRLGRRRNRAGPRVARGMPFAPEARRLPAPSTPQAATVAGCGAEPPSAVPCAAGRGSGRRLAGGAVLAACYALMVAWATGVFGRAVAWRAARWGFDRWALCGAAAKLGPGPDLRRRSVTAGPNTTPTAARTGRRRVPRHPSSARGAIGATGREAEARPTAVRRGPGRRHPGAVPGAPPRCPGRTALRFHHRRLRPPHRADKPTAHGPPARRGRGSPPAGARWPAPVHAALVEEVDAPEDQRPVRWLLLATFPVETAEPPAPCLRRYVDPGASSAGTSPSRAAEAT